MTLPRSRRRPRPSREPQVHNCSRASGTLWAAACLLAGAPAAGAALTVRLRNDLAPGTVAVYAVRVQTTRLTERGESRTFLEFDQHAELTRYVLETPPTEAPQHAQMLVIRPARLMRLEQGATTGPDQGGQLWASDSQPVQPGASATTNRSSPEGKPAPDRDDLGLPPSGVRLNVARFGPGGAPLLMPFAPAVEQAVLQLLVDCGGWPAEPVRAGQSWQHPVRSDALVGQQTCRLRDAGQKARRRLATIDVSSSARFVGRYANRWELHRARSALVWDLANHLLEELTGSAAYREDRLRTVETVTLRIEIARRRLFRLPQASRERTRSELIRIADAVVAFNQHQWDQAERAARVFIGSSPASRWRPIADYILQETRAAKQHAAPLTTAELRDRLTRLVALWQAAVSEDEPRRLPRYRRALERLAQANRPELLRLAAEGDENARAVAVFALAFGTAPADLVTLQKAGADGHPRVRAWAAYGLAIRASPETDLALLGELLEDEAEVVRARGCQAVAACIQPGSETSARFRKKLLARLSDPAAAVRRQAVLALANLGAAEDITALERSRTAEKDPTVRDLIEALIRRLQQRPK